MAKKIPVNHVKALGVFAKLKPRKDLVRKDGDFGTYHSEYKEIEFDPDHEPEGTVIHENGHLYRHVFGIACSDAKEEETAVNFLEQGIVDFVINNPKLAKWIFDGLLAMAKRHGGR